MTERLRRARAAVATAWREVADSLVPPAPELIPLPVRVRGDRPNRGGAR